MRTSTRRVDSSLQAEATLVLLKDEFGVPFRFYDADGEALDVADETAWNPLAEPSPSGGRGPCEGLGDRLGDGGAIDSILEATQRGTVCVRLQASGLYLLALPIYRGRKIVLTAVGQLPPMLPIIEGCPAHREAEVLERWLRAVCDRLRLREQMEAWRHSEGELTDQVAAAWETVFAVDGVMRRLRIHKEAEANVGLVLDAAFRLIRCQGLLWAPRRYELPPAGRGQSCLALADGERLISVLTREGGYAPPQPFICNTPQETSWGSRFPGLENLLVLQAGEPNPVGWLIAVNKPPSPSRGGFRKSDAAILSPLLAILEMYGKGLARFRDLKELLVGLTRSLTAVIDAKDSYTLGHSERVARIAVEVARQLGLSEGELGDVYLAGLLHDIGKIGIQDHVLRKAGPLTAEEFEHTKQHVNIGYAILSDLRAIRNLLPGVLYHHENYDGTGYPDGLKGETIPLLARILAVADAYDSMSTTSAYREAMPCEQVEAELRTGTGTRWDPKVVDALLRVRQAVHAIRQCGVGESLRVAMEAALRNGASINPSSTFTPTETESPAL